MEIPLMRALILLTSVVPVPAVAIPIEVAATLTVLTLSTWYILSTNAVPIAIISLALLRDFIEVSANPI